MNFSSLCNIGNNKCNNYRLISIQFCCSQDMKRLWLEKSSLADECCCHKTMRNSKNLLRNRDRREPVGGLPRRLEGTGKRWRRGRQRSQTAADRWLRRRGYNSWRRRQRWNCRVTLWSGWSVERPRSVQYVASRFARPNGVSQGQARKPSWRGRCRSRCHPQNVNLLRSRLHSP